MSDFIIVDGDTAMFIPAFGSAIVVVQPGTISGSSSAALSGSAVCIEGDEGSVSVPGCAYMAPPYVIPGVGTITIDSLASDQVASKTNVDGTPAILKGIMFNAKFEVQTPAQMPPPASTPDSTPQYSGNGMFITTNTTFKGT